MYSQRDKAWQRKKSPVTFFIRGTRSEAYMEEGGKLARGAGWERVQGTGHQRDKGALASTLTSTKAPADRQRGWRAAIRRSLQSGVHLACLFSGRPLKQEIN